MTDKIINDNVFGVIKIPFYIKSIIDTPQFQRLRYLNQLGVTQFVYPSANHSRFIHSIGVFHLASKLVRKLQQQLIEEMAELQISDVDVKCVEIAALCHDIGHGPMSHFWEDLCIEIKKINKDFQYKKHEELFRDIWKLIKGKQEVNEILVKIGIEKDKENLIENLILGQHENEDDDKYILFLILSNSESGMDVDKWEYLTRDSIQLGHRTSNLLVDVERMIHFARAIKDEKDSKWKIAFRGKESRNIFEIFKLRKNLHESACKHKTVMAIEQMLIDGFLNDNFSIDERNQFGSLNWIIKHTDSYIYDCFHNFGEVIEFQRILNRQLYTLEGEGIKDELVNDIDEEKIKLLNKIVNGRSRYAPVIFEFKNSIREEHPITKIPFYEKGNNKTLYYYDDSSNGRNALPSTLRTNSLQTKCLIFNKDKSTTSSKRKVNEELENLQWKVQKF